MRATRISFQVLEFLGLWRPESWKTKRFNILYNIINIISLINIYFLTTGFIIVTIQNFDKVGDNSENTSCSLVAFMFCFKMTYFYVYRDEIINFLNMFLQETCIPRDKYEMSIWKGCEDFSRFLTRIFVIMCCTVVVGTSFLPLLNMKNIQLPFNCWTPFDIDSEFRFWVNYFYLAYSSFVVICGTAAVEVVASILMQLMCAQLEIMGYRLLKLISLENNNYSTKDFFKYQSAILKDCITHHIYLYSIEKRLNEIFGFMVALQFLVSTLNICTSCYQLTKLNPNSSRFWTLFAVTVCFLTQISYYCFPGEKMIQKSMALKDEIYKMDWNLLTKETKHNLLIIMMRANQPMQLSGASIVNMSVETLVKILKTSYSVFSLIRNVSEN
ncbi:putative odorant receptor 71a isoform X2 [Leptopilina boulardi]|uniref:putative odorant receptor 71a isoform X2 n=1 Tax=Leptopilina boulardi TaxID=63433 RepID=UPI0021F55590|nr:putative odorant receptor 71a isoform X2 [Leptopilina boulardi]